MAATNRDAELEPETLSIDCDKGYSPGKIGVRHLLAVVVFFGFFVDFGLRTNLNVALVVMVNYTENLPKILPNNSECTEDLLSNTKEQTSHQTGEFNWDNKMQGIILGSFYYGYIISQIPGGLLSRKFGSKHLFGMGLLITALASLLTPFAARWNVYALIALRVVEGLAQGVTSPAIHNLWGNWAPKLERSQLIAFSYAGMHFGTFVCIPLAGTLIEYDFLGGWPSVFYVFGLSGCVWWIIWLLVASDSPANHRFISKEEREYIQNSIEVSNEKLEIPWMSILKSKPVWALNITHFCSNWAFYTLLTCLPMYMKGILHFDIQKNALLSGLPYVLFWLICIKVGFIADYIRQKNYLSTGSTRKLMNSIGFILPSIFLIAINFVGCNKVLAVTMVFLAIGTSGFTYSGYLVNHLDLAPPFAGVLFALTNTCATIPGILGPYLVGLITNEQNSSEQWKIIFFISVGIYYVGCGIYIAFGSGDIQPWVYASIRRKSKGFTSDFDQRSNMKEFNTLKLSIHM